MSADSQQLKLSEKTNVQKKKKKQGDEIPYADLAKEEERVGQSRDKDDADAAADAAARNTGAASSEAVVVEEPHAPKTSKKPHNDDHLRWLDKKYKEKERYVKQLQKRRGTVDDVPD